MQGAQLAELEVLYKEEQVLRKRYFNTIEGWHFLKLQWGACFTALECWPLFMKSLYHFHKQIIISWIHFRYERQDQSFLSNETS